MWKLLDLQKTSFLLRTIQLANVPADHYHVNLQRSFETNTLSSDRCRAILDTFVTDPSFTISFVVVNPQEEEKLFCFVVALSALSENDRKISMTNEVRSKESFISFRVLQIDNTEWRLRPASKISFMPPSKRFNDYRRMVSFRKPLLERRCSPQTNGAFFRYLSTIERDEIDFLRTV